MGKYKEDEKIILDKIRKMKKGECPNFYITGNSIPTMENLAYKLAETIIEENLMLFKGLVTHFTIKLPYCEDMKSGYDFLKHFKNSYSIAKDCYDSFCGIILIEVSEKWVRKGGNEELEKILDVFQAYEQVCFIFMVPLKENRGREDRFYSELLRCGIWMKIQSQTVSIEQCVSLFEKTAKENGLRVSDDAREILKKRLSLREETKMENVEVVENLIKQIVFDRSLGKNCKKCIGTKEIINILGTEKNMQKNVIGFTAVN